MEEALSAIAQEIQSLYTPQETESDDIIESIVMVKSKLAAKKKQMKRLRKNMNTAYVVARAVMSAKEDETAYLSKHIQLSREHCERLLQNNRQSNKVIEDLKSKGQNLQCEKEAMEIYINLGFEQLQKMRNLPLTNLTVMEMLKEIIIACGEYYSDYNNECVKTQELVHKNKFLNNYISILEKSNKAMEHEIVTMRTQNKRLQSENQSFKNKKNNGISTIAVKELDHITSDIKLKTTSFSDDSNFKTKNINFNFCSHFTTIKKLLVDQDEMLKSLKQISEEITIQEYSP